MGGRKRPGCSLSSQMVVEILSRLPDKPLFQFRCASKEWQSLIDLDLHWRALPYAMLGFFHRYCAVSRAGIPVAEVYYDLKPQENNTGYKFCQIGSDRSSIATALGFLPFYPDLEILDSCNGLLLCRSTTPVVVYYVCNPATKRWATVPGLDRRYDHVFLAFDPSASLHYKVLWITDYCDYVGDRPTHLGFRLYSSETGRWGKAKGFGTSMTQALVLRHGLFWDEAVYLTDKDRIIKFDIQEESFQLIALPDGFGNTFNSVDSTILGRLAGRVCIAISKGRNLLIWVLDTHHVNGYEWRLKHSIDNMALPERQPSGFFFLSREITIIAFHPVLEIVFALRNSQIYAYDLKSMKFEVLCGVRSEFRTSIYWLIPTLLAY